MLSQWTPSQRRQQISEMLRNKGILCQNYLLNGKCPRSPACPYMHIQNGETRPVPWSVCTFFDQGVCLRDQCAFFHGTQQQLDELRASGAEVYQPQQYMRVAVPPREFLNADGSIAVDNASIPPPPAPQAPPPPFQPAQHPPQQQTMQLYQPLSPVVMLQPSNPLVNAPHIPQMQYHYIHQPAQQQPPLNAYVQTHPPPSHQSAAPAAPQAYSQQTPSQQQALAGYSMGAMSPFSTTSSPASVTASRVPQPPPQPQQQYYTPQGGQQLFFSVPSHQPQHHHQSQQPT